ncbi:MAG: hypothetical protein ACLTDR_04950 [Adlercreutzia equolifaciens]
MDTEGRHSASDGAGEVELTGQTMVIDPRCEFAVERAAQSERRAGRHRYLG